MKNLNLIQKEIEEVNELQKQVLSLKEDLKNFNLLEFQKNYGKDAGEEKYQSLNSDLERAEENRDYLCNKYKLFF